MIYTVSWGSDVDPVEIAQVDELIAVLAAAAQAGEPVAVSVYREVDGEWVGLDIGVGHPDRSFVFWNDTGGGYGAEPEVRVWGGDIVFNYGGTPTQYHPDETRALPQTAIAAAGEFVATGRRPTSLRWPTEPGARPEP